MTALDTPAPRLDLDTVAAEQATVERGPEAPSRRVRSSALRWLLYGLLTAITIVFIYPFVWLVSASFKPRGEVFDNKLIPDTFTVDNYLAVWREAPMALWLANTLLVTVLATVTVTISSAMVAWGFSYFRFRGRGVLFGVVLATMMLPGAVTMIPVYLIWNSLGMVDTQVPLWAQNLFGSAFYIFLMRQFFLGVPRELFEAARVDGASFLRMFWQIALPLCRPALIIVFVFELQASWSDLMKPLIYLQTQEYFTMPRGLKQIVDAFAMSGEYHWEIAMAASVVATVPMIVVFALAQRYFLDGLATTARQG